MPQPPPLPPFCPCLLAFDLDGTLIADGGAALPPDTAEALARLRALGVRFAIITGRDMPPASVVTAMQPDVIATHNGGRIVVGSELRREAHFEPKDLAAVLAHDLNEPRVLLFAGDRMYVDLPPGTQPEPWMLARKLLPLAQAPAAGVSKVRFYHPEVARHAARLGQSHPHLVMTGAQPPYPHFLTVTPAGADKAAALALAAEALDIPLGQTVAFGDSDNDEVMLERAGFAVQVGDLPLLTPHADAQLTDHTAVGAYLRALADAFPVS